MRNIIIGSWQTTVAGFALGFFTYLTQNGTKLPSTKQEWGTAAMAAAMAALGVVAKDGNVGSKGK